MQNLYYCGEGSLQQCEGKNKVWKKKSHLSYDKIKIGKGIVLRKKGVDALSGGGF